MFGDNLGELSDNEFTVEKAVARNRVSVVLEFEVNICVDLHKVGSGYVIQDHLLPSLYEAMYPRPNPA